MNVIKNEKRGSERHLAETTFRNEGVSAIWRKPLFTEKHGKERHLVETTFQYNALKVHFAYFEAGKVQITF